MSHDLVYEGKKWCSRGRHFCDVGEFRPNEAMPSGLHFWCRACVSSYGREWRDANPEAVKQYQAAQRAQYAAEREPLERVCVNAECGKVFVPSRRDAKTCSRVCRSRLSQIRRSERDRARRWGPA